MSAKRSCERLFSCFSPEALSASAQLKFDRDGLDAKGLGDLLGFMPAARWARQSRSREENLIALLVEGVILVTADTQIAQYEGPIELVE